MSESEEEMRWDWLFSMADNKSERVVFSYWPGRSAGENLAVFWGSGDILDRLHWLELVADVTPDGGIYANIIWEDGSRIISVNAGEYLTEHVWVDGRVMHRLESWCCSFVLTPNEGKIVVQVRNPPKLK